MKSIKYSLLGLLLVLMTALSSCADFLETTPSTSVADSEVFKTTAGANAALNGCYRQLQAYSAGGADRGDDYGYPSIMHISDVSAEDMIVWGGWYGYTYNYWGETRGDIFRASQLWTFYYRLINNLNSIIAYVDQSEGSDVDKAVIKGQALALRGWGYFGLARLFQQTYVVAKDMPGMPIYTQPTTEATEGAPRGTLEDTYKQILSDLTQAEPLLANLKYHSDNEVNRVTQVVAQAFLAQVYLTMGNWSQAEVYANKVMDEYPLTDNENYLAGFADHTIPSCIWGFRQTEEENMGDYSQFAMWANGDRGDFWTFQCFYLADDFEALFDEGDIRASQFERWWDMITVSHKFRDNSEGRGSYIVLRTEDMLLTAAEANARMGEEDKAKELLWKLQDMRQAKRSEANGQALLEDIWVERRKELYGEGYGLFDLLRTEKGLVRGGNHVGHGGSFQFPKYSWRLVYQIPASELKNNHSLVDDIWPAGDQNPFDGVYQPK